MATPRARALTAAHRRELSRLVTIAAGRTRTIAAGADVMAIADWWAAGADRRVLELVAGGHRAAAALGARYLRAHAAASGATVDPVTPRLDLEAARASLFITSVGAFMTHLRAHGEGSERSAQRSMTNQLVASVQRQILNGSRATLTETFAAGR